MLEYLYLAYVIVAVAFLFGFCVFIHELGHFLAAKWLGLHIIAFSIGFKKVWAVTWKGVEYRVGCLPFGGYVDLPQIDATGDPVDQHGNPLPRAKASHRAIVAFCGPLFNVLFGFALATFLWIHGIPQDSPQMKEIVVKSVEPASNEFKAGLREGDHIVKVNGQKFKTTWLKLVQDLLFATGDVELTVLRGDRELTFTYATAVNPRSPRLAKEGLPYPFFLPDIPVVVSVKPGSPAAAMGLKDKDRVLKIDGLELLDHNDFPKLVQASAGRPMALLIERDGQRVELPEVKAAADTKAQVHSDGASLEPSAKDVAIVAVNPGSPAAKAGIQTGDIILDLNGKKVEFTSDISDGVNADTAKAVDLLLRRDGREIKAAGLMAIYNPEVKRHTIGVSIDGATATVDLALKVLEVEKDSAAAKAGLVKGDVIVAIAGGKLNSPEDYLARIRGGDGNPLGLTLRRDGKLLAVTLTPELFVPYRIEGVSLVILSHPNPWEQFVGVIDMTRKTLVGIFSHKSKISAKHMSGPVGIVNVIGTAIYSGSLILALNFIVMITFSLGLLNLLPIPVLDGGHILIALIEIVIRRPLPAMLVQPLSIAFVVLLITLMVFVTYNDVDRLADKSISGFIKKRIDAVTAPAADTQPKDQGNDHSATPKKAVTAP